MGMMPVGKPESSARSTGSVAGSLDISGTDFYRFCAALMMGGSLLGLLGVALPHPSSFQVPQLLILNAASIASAVFVWFAAPRVPLALAPYMTAIGSMAVTLSVIFSRDATSAYALLYIFPGVYAFYFLSRRDATLNIAFAALNYALAIWYLSTVSSSPTTAGSVGHHFVITVGMLVVVGAMVLYLRNRVEWLMGRMFAAARTDLSTGLLNGRGLLEALNGELDRARMGGSRVAMLTVQFTGVRDLGRRFGQQAVDDALAEAGSLLDDSTRRMDSVARTGPTEFSLVIPETDESTAFLLAEQILARTRRTLREREMPLAAGIGVASFPKHASSAEGLAQAAAAAAEAAQVLGADRAVIFSEELQDVLGGDPSRGLTERRTHLSTVLSLAEVLDLRDARTAAHSLSVSHYCEMLGRELGLSEQRIQRLRLAGLVHDIGKVGIPDQILDKPSPLSPAEWDQVRRHPEMAARILGARELTDIREWVLARHEQPDGHGYPRGLSGDSIPLESRILAVAESFDAMTSERPYRPARTPQEAIEELGRYSGSQFDGAVVDAMVRALEGEGKTLRLGGGEGEA
jgi:diguanylate cyclase (GGDEF)-like protein